MKNILSGTLLVILFTALACKKLVEVDSPQTKFDANKVYEKDVNAIAVLTAFYQEMSMDFGFTQGTESISFIAGLSADELIDYPGSSSLRTAAYQNQLSATAAPFWSRFYFFIYTANTAIKGITDSKSLSPQIKQELLGEAKFMRAFAYYYLVNLWGDVPLMVTNDYRLNNVAGRSTIVDVYAQIITDLQEATNLLSADYLMSDLKTISKERIRPNKWAAKALLARAYLFIGDYNNAVRVASEVIGNQNTFEICPLNDVFLISSKEAIWQIQGTSIEWNTYDGKGFILFDGPTSFQPVSLSKSLMTSFESGDLRRELWTGTITVSGNSYNYPYKYKVVKENAPKTEYLMVLRLAEQYLIRAEARAKSGDIAGAVADINVLRSRARATPTIQIPDPLPPLSASLGLDKVLNAILHERRVELFTEWGHRWFDLKRTKNIDAVMELETPLKGGVWSSNKALYPIPHSDVVNNANIKQNDGY